MVNRLVYIQRAIPLVRKHENQGLEFLDPEIVSAYARKIDERYYSGEIKRLYHAQIKRAIDRFLHYAYLGNCDVRPSPLSGARVKLSPEFTRIAEEFFSGNFHPCPPYIVLASKYRISPALKSRNFGISGTQHLQELVAETIKSEIDRKSVV